MLKIVDSAGKKIGELKDGDSAPVMEVVPTVGIVNVVLDDEPEQEEKDCLDEEGETKDGSDVC